MQQVILFSRGKNKKTALLLLLSKPAPARLYREPGLEGEGGVEDTGAKEAMRATWKVFRRRRRPEGLRLVLFVEGA